jgi:hypothetical protein
VWSHFFQTSEGRLHAGRLAGVVYTVALLPGCYLFVYVDAMCVARIVFTVGWWLSFCDKRPAHTGSELLTNARRVLGIVLVVVGIVGQFYAIRFGPPHRAS